MHFPTAATHARTHARMSNTSSFSAFFEDPVNDHDASEEEEHVLYQPRVVMDEVGQIRIERKMHANSFFLVQDSQPLDQLDIASLMQLASSESLVSPADSANEVDEAGHDAVVASTSIMAQRGADTSTLLLPRIMMAIHDLTRCVDGERSRLELLQVIAAEELQRATPQVRQLAPQDLLRQIEALVVDVVESLMSNLPPTVQLPSFDQPANFAAHPESGVLVMIHDAKYSRFSVSTKRFFSFMTVISHSCSPT